MKFLTSIDLSKNELQNAVIQPLASAPDTDRPGQIYYNSTDKKLYQFDGTNWIAVGTAVKESSENGNIIIDGNEVSVYDLPVSSVDTLGGIKEGTGIKISEDGTASTDINHYVGDRNEGETDDQVFARVLGDINPYNGDTFVIRTLISGDKKSYTAYVYDEGKWNAMDGNVDATNVILRDDIVAAGNYSQVGNITKGSKDLVAGKSIAEILQAIFTKELDPTKTDPKVVITFPEAGAKEVGTKVTPTYSVSLDPGKYTYDESTGVTATSWEVSDSDGNESTDTAGSFSEITVEDDTEYKITAKANHTEGTVPHTNLGNDYSEAKIPAGSKSATSGAITGYRSFFYGANVTAVELNSDNIRSLTNSGKSVGTSQTFDMEIPEGATQVIIAFPADINKTLSNVLDEKAFGTDIVASFIKSNVDVEGANDYDAISYDLYVYAPDSALGANKYTVTIS